MAVHENVPGNLAVANEAARAGGREDNPADRALPAVRQAVPPLTWREQRKCKRHGITEFHCIFRPDGVSTKKTCLQCRTLYTMRYRARHQDRFRALQAGYYVKRKHILIAQEQARRRALTQEQKDAFNKARRERRANTSGRRWLAKGVAESRKRVALKWAQEEEWLSLSP